MAGDTEGYIGGDGSCGHDVDASGERGIMD
jgi:hypothetical protein